MTFHLEEVELLLTSFGEPSGIFQNHALVLGRGFFASSSRVRESVESNYVGLILEGGGRRCCQVFIEEYLLYKCNHDIEISKGYRDLKNKRRVRH